MPTGAGGEGERVRACNAPFSSMYLDPRGNVRACCQNIFHPLGNVTSGSLLDIWHGSAANSLRRAVGDGDLTLGCDLCAADIRVGSRDTAHLREFDDLPPRTSPPDWPRQLELALSIACNLQCVMCNGELSSSIRIHREGRAALPPVYGDDFFAELDEFLPHLDRVTFLGGEPFLGAEPLRVMERVLELGLSPVCHVNTNGTQWSSRIRRIVDALPFHVAVSVDGRSPALIERVRRGVDGEHLIRNVAEMRRACEAPGKSFSLTFCLMTVNHHELVDVLAWGDELECDVFVNTVVNPPAMSLHHLSPTELTSVVDGLRSAGSAQQLGRNQAVLDRMIHYVESLAARPVSLSGRRSAGTPDRARQLIEEWAADRPIVTMDVDESLIITALGPSTHDALGVDVAHLVGDTSASFLAVVGPILGELTRSEVDLRADGVELRRFEFRNEAGTVELAAAMAQRPGGETWFIARRDAVGRPAGGAC